MRRLVPATLAALLLAGAALPARAECPGTTDLERARCTQIRKDPAASAGATADAEARRRDREVWRDGYRAGQRDARSRSYDPYDPYAPAAPGERRVYERGVIVVPSQPD